MGSERRKSALPEPETSGAPRVGLGAGCLPRLLVEGPVVTGLFSQDTLRTEACRETWVGQQAGLESHFPHVLAV